MMTPERWHQIDELLQATLACPMAERAVYLASACNGDAELRREVESLLQFHSQADEFLEAPPVEVAAEIVNADREHSLLGRTINRYRIERQIGAGGMGVVYLARDTELNRPAALKVLPAQLTQDADRVRRFRQEARATSALNHPNILTIYDVGQIDDEQFIASEFVQGRTLRELLHNGVPSLHDALDWTTQVAGALAAAHEAGIVHRDIKPENIMVRRDGYVKVLDFGLAKLLEKDEGGGMKDELKPDLHPSSFILHPSTMPGLILGTVRYMSPEQARGVTVDARSDLFSLGVVLYELLTGRQPFQGETKSDVIAALLEREPPPLTNYLPAASPALQGLVNRALAKPVTQRFQSATEMLSALKSLQHELDFSSDSQRASANSEISPPRLFSTATDQSTVSHHGTATASQRWYGGLPKRRRALLFAGLGLLLLGAFGGYWIKSRKPAIKAVAVLPFSSEGNSAPLEFVPDTLMESLIDSLTQLSSLRVSARTTVIGYKGREIDPRQAGKDLQVPAVITGHIVWQGERMVVRVELIDTADGARVWGDEFRLHRTNLLNGQDEIVREIAAKLQGRLSPETQQQLTKRQTTNSKAYDLYAQGRYLYLRYNRESQEKALEYFRQAITYDPKYALAYCGIADVYADFSGQYMPPGEAIPKAREAALKALELDETLPEAHHSLALIKWWGDWNWSGAEREIKRALELNPNLVNTRIYYAEFLSCQKRFEEALREIKRAEDYDPGSMRAVGWEAGINIRMRQYEQALEIYRKVVERYPDNAGAKRQTALILSHKGQHQDALALWLKLYTPDQSADRLAWLDYFYAKAGRRNEALKALRELEERAKREQVRPFSFVLIYLGLGDYEKAIALLQKSYTERQEYLLNLVDPVYDPVRNDPRFVEILRGVGLAL